MYKRWWIVALALSVVSLTGCELFDALFFNTEEVNAKELATFQGDTPATKDEALMSLSMGLGGTADMFLSKDFVAPSILDSVFSITGGQELYSGAVAAARKITPSNGFESFAQSIESTGSGKTKVTLVAEDFGSNGAVTVDGTIAVEAQGLTQDSTKASGKIDADVKAKLASIANSPIRGAMANLKLKANADATIDRYTRQPSAINGYSALALSMGLSMDSFAAGGTTFKGGKYVMSFKYTSKFTYTASSTANPVSELELTIYLKVYNNTNKVVGDYTYTQSDIERIFVR